MGLWEILKSVFDFTSATQADVRRLNASSRSTLSSSLRSLPEGKRGWISFAEARSLFSAMDDQYAFGEMDEQGNANLASFAAEPEHRSTFDFMPIESRVYFTRQDKA
jgi:hypothetical protein